MADRGFTIHDGVALKQAQLVIPAFTKGKEQFNPIDVKKTRGIAHVRIHRTFTQKIHYSGEYLASISFHV